MDLYVLDGNLEAVGLIDTYTSLIWASRYWDLGDCELYLEATAESLALMRKNYYLMRPDSEMLCQIKKIELDTDAENGNYLIVTGYDVKRYLYQRIIWGTVTINGNLEDAIRSIVDSALGSILLMQRSLKKTNGDRMFYLGDSADLPDVTTEQVSYKNIGEKVREYCVKYGWGSRVILENGNLYFELYKGADRRNSVVFSDAYENLSATKYIEDETHLGNVALVGGQGDGPNRSKGIVGDAGGVDRYEIFVDAKDISKAITWEELIATYPLIDAGGEGYISTDGVQSFYKMRTINIQIVDDNHLRELQRKYPDGTIITIDGTEFYEISDATIADLPSSSPEPTDEVTLRDLIYLVYLLNRGYEKLAEYGAITAFEGSIDPNTTFVYKRDYFLGDIVTIENEYGISVAARITEIVEYDDTNGYRIEPKFEYITED